jgi:hypothetical protein
MCPGADGGATEAGFVEASRGAGKTTRLEAGSRTAGARAPLSPAVRTNGKGRKMRQSEKESGK